MHHLIWCLQKCCGVEIRSIRAPHREVYLQESKVFLMQKLNMWKNNFLNRKIKSDQDLLPCSVTVDVFLKSVRKPVSIRRSTISNWLPLRCVSVSMDLLRCWSPSLEPGGRALPPSERGPDDREGRERWRVFPKGCRNRSPSENRGLEVALTERLRVQEPAGCHTHWCNRGRQRTLLRGERENKNWKTNHILIIHSFA